MKIAIVGSGNVATVLVRGLITLPDVEVIQILSRNQHKGEFLANLAACRFTQDLQSLDPSSEICFLCVGDDAIQPVATALRPMANGTLFVHTSGATPSSILDRLENFGVFYPLQTLSKDRMISWDRIPVYISANTQAAKSTLAVLAAKLGSPYQKITDDQRLVIHLAAVIANNFPNALYALASNMMEQSDLDPKMLHPLMLEGTSKACEIGPLAAQTGPARRNDLKTISNHLKMLEHDPDLTELYQNLTRLIQRFHS